VNGTPGIDFTFRETDCFQKKAGKWTLMHQHLASRRSEVRQGRCWTRSEETAPHTVICDWFAKVR
jgi:hypothetical protein